MESVTDVSMFGVWGDSPSNVLAVGVGGTILRFDGSRWDFMSSPAGENLSAVWGASADDVWAVGDVGTLLHFNGTAWSVVSVETEDNLYDVWGSAANDVWVVGAVGTILHFDGSDWTAIDSSVVESLYGIWGRSRNEAYAVGANGTILHWGADPDDDPNVTVYVCHDHPDGSAAPPSYGLRLDKLLGDGKYTFSFDYADETESARVTLSYDADASEITISGRAYGGKVEQGFLAPSQSGWIDIDFTYAANVMMVNGCGQGEGDDLYVVAQSSENRGTIELDGWGDDAVFEVTDKGDTSGCSFDLDNDRDSKDNESIANDPTVWSATGWLQPNNGGATDWLFIAEEEIVDEELALNP